MSLCWSGVGEDKEDAPAAGPGRRQFPGAGATLASLGCPANNDRWDSEGVSDFCQISYCSNRGEIGRVCFFV